MTKIKGEITLKISNFGMAPFGEFEDSNNRYTQRFQDKNMYDDINQQKGKIIKSDKPFKIPENYINDQ